MCDQIEWSDEAVIGYNAGGEYNTTHPLSGTLQANAIDCVHINANSTVNNVVYDLVPGELNDGPTPTPPSSLGMSFNHCKLMERNGVYVGGVELTVYINFSQVHALELAILAVVKMIFVRVTFWIVFAMNSATTLVTVAPISLRSAQLVKPLSDYVRIILS